MHLQVKTVNEENPLGLFLFFFFYYLLNLVPEKIYSQNK